jgi:hypothetical protein
MNSTVSIAERIRERLASDRTDSPDNPCLCGIPECPGHEDLGGYIVIPKLVHQLFLDPQER